jgi:hypothetical protein
MPLGSPSIEFSDCTSAFLPPGPGIHDSFSPISACTVSALGDGPAGPTSSPGSELIVSTEKMLSQSTVLGTVTYLLRRKNPDICSLFQADLISTPESLIDNIAVCCKDDHTEVCGTYPSVKDFILAVRSSRHPKNQLFESQDSAHDDDDFSAPRPTIGERPGFARPASLLSDSDVPSSNSRDVDAPSAPLQLPAPQSVPMLPSRSTLLPRPAAPSLLLIDEPDPPPPARSRSPDRESRARARPASEGPDPAAGPTPGSPMRGVSPRRAALLEG